jgi:hypothetical protein
LRAHCRTVSWLTMMPRAPNNSSTIRSPKREAKIQSDSVADDLGGQPVAGLAGASSCRRPTPPSPRCAIPSERAAKLTVPLQRHLVSRATLRIFRAEATALCSAAVTAA